MSRPDLLAMRSVYALDWSMALCFFACTRQAVEQYAQGCHVADVREDFDSHLVSKMQERQESGSSCCIVHNERVTQSRLRVIMGCAELQEFAWLIRCPCASKSRRDKDWKRDQSERVVEGLLL